MAKRAINATIAVALCGLAVSCDGVITADLERAWQSKHRSVILAGFKEFRGLDISIDVGVDIFSYRIPEGITPADAMRQIEKQARALEPCYQVVVARGSEELRLRCPTETLGYHGFDEYVVHISPSTRRATVMWGNFDSEVEVNQQHRYFDASFWRWAEQQ